MTDLAITRNAELMLAQVEGASDEAVEFVDAWTPSRAGAHYEVVDSGRIIVEDDDLAGLLEQATVQGLTHTIEEQPPGLL